MTEIEYLQIENRIDNLRDLLKRYKEDVEQVELFGMQRDDYAQKKQQCVEIIQELRQLETQLKQAEIEPTGE